jgi:hypothetical protein
MMKKAGFRPHIAGGIEPAASIGGMFMPPIMGAGGFIMAELTGVPYSRIMLVGLFPAFMYFFSVFVMVHYEAKMHNIVGERSEHSAMEILKKNGSIPCRWSSSPSSCWPATPRATRPSGTGHLHLWSATNTRKPVSTTPWP